MATILNSNIYPPVIKTALPAFILTDDPEDYCKIYFDLSFYNKIEDLNQTAVHITLSYQKTNRSALKDEKEWYPIGIKLGHIEQEQDGRYYTIIRNKDLKDEKFQLNTYYKVQLRFTSKILTNRPPDGQLTAEWFTENADKFSEWSTVCLIRRISKMSLKLISDSIEYLTTTSIVGRVTFNEAEEAESIESYQVQLLNIKENTILEDSGKIISSSFKSNKDIIYNFKYEIKENTNYIVKIFIVTKTGFIDLFVYKLKVSSSSEKNVSTEIFSITTDDENGVAEVEIKITSLPTSLNKLYIRRSDYQSNFLLWEDVYTYIRQEEQSLHFAWKDFTVESGVWYKYAIQIEMVSGARASMIINEKPILLNLEHILLKAEDQQLKIKFNPQISSFKRTVSETKIDTIGSKYTFIRRNGNMDYRQFSLSGLIFSIADENENFDINYFNSKEKIYNIDKKYVELYDNYNQQHNVSKYNDIIYERFYREKVMNFLYKNTIKLYRSPTEGNILVKLMDINLTPEQTLGRLVYSFSCTAYEVDEASLENLFLYDICNKENYIILDSQYIELEEARKEATFSSAFYVYTYVTEEVFNVEKYKEEI